MAAALSFSKRHLSTSSRVSCALAARLQHALVAGAGAQLNLHAVATEVEAAKLSALAGQLPDCNARPRKADAADVLPVARQEQQHVLSAPATTACSLLFNNNSRQLRLLVLLLCNAPEQAGEAVDNHASRRACVAA